MQKWPDPTDDGLGPLRDVIEKYQLNARKSLGQNFLLDLNLTRKVARLAGPLEGCDVLEIGPGPGGLTRALLAEGARKVVAVERDERCLNALEEIAQHYPGRLQIIAGDALKIDHASLMKKGAKIISNLPYNIGTLLLTRWLSAESWPPFYTSLTLMFQTEVARRICAVPGDKHYGRLSVLAGWRCETEIVLDVPARAFTPVPKVNSSVVMLRPRHDIEEGELGKLERVTAAAFGQRRKMLRASLKSLGGADLLEQAGIDPTLRAEVLSVSQFLQLARLI
ncbi:MAG: 16S rRNA (adenine(1518)-N(6)/adenine(1519)-N(6))-dimethyltransferase RsmA [Pseudomonadota bacterium]